MWDLSLQLLLRYLFDGLHPNEPDNVGVRHSFIRLLHLLLLHSRWWEALQPIPAVNLDKLPVIVRATQTDRQPFTRASADNLEFPIHLPSVSADTGIT